jgi:hypothetical protein
MPPRLVIGIAFGFVCCGEAFGGSTFANRADVVRILRDESFRIVRQVDKLPHKDLIAANVIESAQPLRSFLANPGEHYQTFDGWIDETKPYRQLIIAGTSSSYMIICFFETTHGGPSRKFMLIRRRGKESRVVFYALLNEEVRSWSDLERVVRDNQIDEIISASHPYPYATLR